MFDVCQQPSGNTTKSGQRCLHPSAQTVCLQMYVFVTACLLSGIYCMFAQMTALYIHMCNSPYMLMGNSFSLLYRNILNRDAYKSIVSLWHRMCRKRLMNEEKGKIQIQTNMFFSVRMWNKWEWVGIYTVGLMTFSWGKWAESHKAGSEMTEKLLKYKTRNCYDCVELVTLWRYMWKICCNSLYINQVGQWCSK